MERDSFKTRWGFILACIGSAVGCGNIWRFPIMVSRYGGMTYIIPYLIFVLLVAHTGIIEEFAFGRAAKGGPIEAFSLATQRAGRGPKLGKAVGIVPVLGSLGLAIGYTCVFGWILKYCFMSYTGAVTALGTDMDQLGYTFGVETASAGANNNWIIIAVVLALAVSVFGISGGIERANKVMMPALFGVFVILAIYIATLDGAIDGYRYIFHVDPKGLLDPHTWIYAFGQAFFSLSVAGNGSIIYGSYLKDAEDVIYSARRVAFFDTLASFMATIVILPAMAAAGVSCDSSGPGLIFIYLVNVFNTISGGNILAIVFFTLFVFAALSSIINLYEVSISFVQFRFMSKRAVSSLLVLAIGGFVAIQIQGIASQWMDVVNNFICPIGALLAAIMFYWVCGREFAEKEMGRGAKKEIAAWYYPLGKYAFCAACVIALVAGAILGGIG